MAVSIAHVLEMQFSAPTWTGVTPDLLSDPKLHVVRGISDPTERVARVGQLTFALKNADNAYSPDHGSATAGFDIGTPVRVRATYASITYDLFRGRIVEIDPEAGTRSRRVTTVVAYDDMDQLDQKRINLLALQVNQRSDQIVSAVASNVYTPVGTDYATGQDTFAFAGDTWRDEETTGRQAIADVVKSEWGVFYIEGDGTLVFQDRHYRPKNFAADLTLNAASDPFTLELGRQRADMANRVEVSVTPRKTGTAASVMWTLEDTPLIPAGATVVYRAEYTDPDQQAARVGGQSMVNPVATTDYTMNSQAGGGGTNLTGNFTVTATFGANAADLEIENTGTVDGYITLLRIRGTPLLTYQTLSRIAEDATSQSTYGILDVGLDMPIQDDPTVAGNLADWMLAARKDPLTRVRQIRVVANRNATLAAAALSLDVSSVVDITEAQTGLSGARFYVEGIEHEIGSAWQHVTTWTVSAADRDIAWVLGLAGRSELGQTTVLGM